MMDTITGTGAVDNGQGIRLLRLIQQLTNLTNDGTISGTAGNLTGGGIGLSSNSNIGTLTNDGTISGSANGG